MKNTLIAGLLATATFLLPTAGSAETLIFGTANNERHPIVTKFFTPWVEKINAESEGAFEIEMRNGQMLVNPGNFVDRLTDDVVQLAWGMPVFAPGRFPRSLVSTIPLLEATPAATNLAYCRLLEAGEMGDEWDDYVPLMIVPFPQVSAHLNGAPLTSMEDLKGKKIMTSSPIAAGMIQAYGGTPLSINIQEQYQALQRGTADGTFMSFTAFPGFRLNEVTTNHMDAPLGGATGVVFMMKSRFDALPAKAQAVLKANSGCDLAVEVGKKVAGWEAGSKGFVAKGEGHTFTKLSDEGLAELKARVSDKIVAGFDGRVPGGAALIEKYKEEIAKASKELMAN